MGTGYGWEKIGGGLRVGKRGMVKDWKKGMG